MLFFVATRSNRKDCYCWWKYGHKVMWTVTKTLFFVIPLISLLLFTWKCIDGTVFSKTNSTFISWIAACALINAFTVGSYAMHIRHIEANITKEIKEMDK